MAAVDLLDAGQERDLAARMERGRQAAARLDAGADGGANEAALRAWVRDGEEARRQFILANLRLVIHIARRYRNRSLDFMDLIQEGNLGLIEAVDHFDGERGNRFSTYAGIRIRRVIERALVDRGRLIRLPVYLDSRRRALYAARERLRKRRGREPAAEELATVLGDGWSADGVMMLDEASMMPMSLDGPIVGDGSLLVGETVADASEQVPFEHAVEARLREEVAAALATLEPREATVLELAFGLGGRAACTLQAIGNGLGLTKERVRQIKARALRKLRAYDAESGRLRGFLD